MRIRSRYNPVHTLIAHILNSYLRYSTTKYLSVLIVLAVVTGIDCKDDPPVVPPPPPPYKQSIFLSVADSGLTEVYLKLSMTDTLPPRGYAILRNNVQILSGSLFGKETTLVDTTAQLNTNYFYQAFRLENSTRKDSSSIVTTKTLDTTSHEFVWQVYEIGGAASSVFYDVAINSFNDIWAVGQIYILDSTGQGYEIFNAAKWDGTKWNFIKVPVRDFGMLVGTFPLKAIFAYSNNNIWTAGFADLIHWDGLTFTSKAFFMLDETFYGQVNRLWGNKDENLYVVGNTGALYIFQQNSWKKITTNTTQPLTDIFGMKQQEKNIDEILCIGSSRTQYNGKVLLKINEAGVEQHSFGNIPGSMISVWFVPGQRYYLVGSGVYSKRSIDTNWITESTFPPSYKNIVRGTAINNVFVAGDFGLISHFNGKTWKHFTDLEPAASLRGLAVTDSLVVAVGGLANGKAIVIFGKHK